MARPKTYNKDRIQMQVRLSAAVRKRLEKEAAIARFRGPARNVDVFTSATVRGRCDSSEVAQAT